MDKYQITATIEKIDFVNNEIKLQLKGSGKWFFETDDNDKKIHYNILEHTDIDKTKSKFLKSSNDFYIEINNNIASNLLSRAFIENKRLKFEIEYDDTNKSKEYHITSISKAD